MSKCLHTPGEQEEEEAQCHYTCNSQLYIHTLLVG